MSNDYLKYIRVQFSEEEIEDFKKRTEEKNKRFEYNNLNREVNTRWVGMACEEALKELLNSKGIQYTHHSGDQKKDDRDFTIQNLEIDVKAVSTSYFPKPHYACNIDNRQWQKIMREENIINTLLFMRFLLTTNEAIILGVIAKERLKNSATFYPKGTVRGMITLNTDNWELPIMELEPIEAILG